MAEDAPKDVPIDEAPKDEPVGEKPADEPVDDAPKDVPAEPEKPIFQVSAQERKMEQKMVKSISRMPQNVQSRFQALHIFSDERSKVNDLFEQEVRELSEAFEKRKLPILEKRDKIIAGELTEFDDMVVEFNQTHDKLVEAVSGIVKTAKQKQIDEEEEKEHKPLNVDHLKDKKGVDDFWKIALKNHAMLHQFISEKDQEVLEHLTGLKCTQAKLPNPQLTVTMTFDDNDFFTNKELTFKASADNDTNQTSEVIGCEIDWKADKDLTKKKVKKTQKNKKTGEKRVIVKTIPQDSFFNFFKDTQEPEGIHDKEPSDVDSEDDKIMQQLGEAHEASNDLYDLYTLDALEFYLGFGPKIEEDDDLFNQDGDSDSDNSDGGDNKDDGKKKKKGGDGGDDKKDGAKGGEEGKKEECKQQ